MKDLNCLIHKSGGIVALLVFLTALSACSNGDNLADLKSFIAKVKARPVKPLSPLPEIKTLDSFTFEPDGMRNPFMPAEKVQDVIDVVTTGGGIKPDLIRSREELESYPLDSLRMVGTVNYEGFLWGLVKASDGTIHRVRKGNYMGRQHGRIKRVLADQIELQEIVSDGPGVWREQSASLMLAE